MNHLPTLLNILLLSLAAGLGTSLGGLIAIVRRPGRRMFGGLMGMAAGVMISLAFLELVNQAWEMGGFWSASIGFGLGAGVMFVLDYFLPHIRFGERETAHGEPLPPAPPCGEAPPLPQHLRYRAGGRRTAPAEAAPARLPHLHRHRGRPHRRRLWQLRFDSGVVDVRLLKTGILLLVGITLHNIPEGFAVGAGYLHAPRFGLLIAIAILLHNIPEGIATALPLCRCGVCRWDAFKAAALSGLTEPFGALVAALFLGSFAALVPAGLAFAGGVMVFITLDELIPAAREHGHEHYTALGIIAGSLFVFVLSGVFGV